MNEILIEKMTEIVEAKMRRHKNDFYSAEYGDRGRIAKAESFPMIWIVGPLHTFLLGVGDYEERFLDSLPERVSVARGEEPFMYYFDPAICNIKEDDIYLVERDRLGRISESQAKAVIKDIVRPVLVKHKSLIPKRWQSKVRVEFDNIPLSEIKLLISEGGGLGDRLRTFHGWSKVSEDHHVRVSYDRHSKRFSCQEAYNGSKGVFGEIVYHGSEEEGYAENGSYQLVRSYGWSFHS